jgi:hypothetical protein
MSFVEFIGLFFHEDIFYYSAAQTNMLTLYSLATEKAS